MQTGRKDLLWNYAATIMRVLSGIIILPITLRLLPPEEMGLWAIFLSLTTITSLLDFGFTSSFSRNVTYVFSGVKELKANGYGEVEEGHVDYGLLKSLLSSMKFFYGIIALIFLLIFLVASPFYFLPILEKFSGDHAPVLIAWFLFGFVLAYELYTYYYGNILTGCGKIKTMQQITVLTQSIRIIVTIVLLLLNMGLLALVLGMLIGDLINRILSYNAFYDRSIRQNLRIAQSGKAIDVIKIIAPNSIKIGLNVFGGFLRSKAIVLIAPYYITLSDLGSFGISRTMVDVITSLGGTWFITFYPQLSQYIVRDRMNDVKRLYIKSMLVSVAAFVLLGCGMILFGNPILVLIKSKTFLLCGSYLLLMLIFSFLEQNQGIATNILLAQNEVPFFKSALLSGINTVLIFWIMLKFTHLGILSMILSSGIALSLYVNWRWPLEVYKRLKLQPNDFVEVVKSYLVKLH
ncbi:MAG: putative rane protein [Bacteroidetes bacterium]|nr:putative rane protein [Bacteroidota bacterium]